MRDTVYTHSNILLPNVCATESTSKIVITAYTLCMRPKALQLGYMHGCLGLVFLLLSNHSLSCMI